MNKEQLENARINLKKWRVERGWTHEEAAEMLQVSIRHYYHLEKGTKNISTRVASKMMTVFNVTYDDIFLK